MPASDYSKDPFMTERAARKILRPYGAELGLLVFSWNRLQENLAKLFELVIKPASENIGLAIWYSTDSDFAQRKMLRSAVEKAHHLKAEQIAGILWALNQIDESLRHKRNDALHAPIAVATGDFGEGETQWVIPDLGSENPRAKSLWAKKNAELNLKGEFKDYAKFANLLAGYTHLMVQHFESPSTHPWPGKPKLPHAHQKKSRKAKSRRSMTK